MATVTKFMKSAASGNASHLGFEATLWATADKLRGNLDAAEYKHVVLGLIFLQYISDASEEKRAELVALPGQFFYSTQVRVCLWFLEINRAAEPERDARLVGGANGRDFGSLSI